MAKVKKDDEMLSEDDILDENDNGWKAQDDVEEDDGLDFTMDDDPADEVNKDSGVGEDEAIEKAKKADEDSDDSDEDEGGDEDSDEDEDESEDDGDDDSDEDDADPDENKENYSKKVQKRIAREQKLKREADARAEEAEQRAYEAEMRAYEAEKVGIEALQKENEQEIKNQKAILVKAKEDDESEKEADAQVELMKLVATKERLESGAKGLKEPEKRVARAPEASPSATKWVNRNRWFQDPAFQSEADYARSIDKQLGNDPQWKGRVGEADYFAELDRRIHAKMPSLKVQIKKTYSSGKTKKVNKHNGVSRTSGNVARKQASNRITITPEIRRKAAEYGLTSKDELKAYAREIWKREQREARQKGAS